MRSAECGVERGMLTLVAAALAFQSQVADTSLFRALPLPAVSRVRSASGAPGPDYWQQRADYVIRATLDTAGSVLQGSERIHYERSEEHTSELQSRRDLVCRLLLEKKKKKTTK